ncbi:hypothetical protein KHF85_08910 [Xanthomonas translucens pv. graminis]|uniref:hypothetical protein n=1 Tax=Xanthomonas graminis TaxID=3390026 RepID=UPI0025402A95|nr:hypothetical protein [Xanthomonas translucens]WIH06496.1 hypothetical protein KHF85_08910 [Xanthomonas translucens pv. graminis]
MAVKSLKSGRRATSQPLVLRIGVEAASKEKEIYSFPVNGLTPACRAIDKLKESVRLDGDFEKKAYSTCKK